MRHTAGFSSDDDTSPVGELFRAAKPTELTNTLAEMAKKLSSVPLLYQPGTRWLYGPSVDVQAFLVERIAGQPFESYLQKQVLDPLLNEGELDGVRVLSAEAVRLMKTNAMPAEVTDTSWLPSKGQVGFGIDFAVRIAPPANAEEASGAVGEFFWDGLANTLFWVDPKNDIAAVLFTQFVPFGEVPLHKTFRDAVYYADPAAAPASQEPG
jgi:CubicO group peptidase (beta-lactamase class C family)